VRLPAGTTVGPYEVTAPLGSGGMGEVYRGLDVRRGRQVALKLLLPDAAEDQERLRRFQVEAAAAGLLDHPNVVAVLDVGTHEGASYVVSELLEGDTLRARLLRGAVPPEQARDWVLQIARGLAAAHARGIVHRDLKPENVFLTGEGVVKLLDFGLAKVAGHADSWPGQVLGTAAYMSPEQARGRPADARSDVFALGSVLYEMVAGQRAFAGSSALVAMSAVLRDEPEWPAPASPEAARLLRVARRCLRKEPRRRYSSAAAVVADLEASPAWVRAARPWPRRALAWLSSRLRT
jgi:eukaryotic-like serine/threonine-protein kinase